MKRFILIILFLLFTVPSWAVVRSFDNTNDQISMGNVLDITTGDVSVCIWTNTTDNDDTDHIIGKKNNATVGAAGYQLRQGSPADALVWRVSDGTTQVSSSATTDPDGAWTFTCATWDGTNNVTRIYTNAVQEDTDTNTVGSLTNAVNFIIGESPDGTADMAGLAAYSMQFSSILTVVEIQEFMYRPDMAYGAGGLWPLLGDSTEVDWSGNGRTGTVTGATTNANGPPVIIGDASS